MKDEILFQGAKEKTSNVSGPSMSGRGRPRAATPQTAPRTARPTAAKPGRPTPPPPQTDGQRREALDEGRSNINPFRDRNDAAGTGIIRSGRSARRRAGMAARRASRDAAAAPAPVEATPSRRRLRPKPGRS